MDGWLGPDEHANLGGATYKAESYNGCSNVHMFDINELHCIEAKNRQFSIGKRSQQA